MKQLYKIKHRADSMKLASLVMYGSIIGVLVGILISIYRKLVIFLQSKMILFYESAKFSIVNLILVLLVIFIFGLIVGKLTENEPKIGGSGIPQVSGQMKGIMSINWKKVLPFKFIGGLIGLVSGLTVGREGPSVQMGATVGQSLGEIGNRKEEDKKLFITAGAAAGLSSAFNAPLSGLVFVLEELHQKFDRYIFLIAASAAFLSDYVSSLIFGTKPVIDVGHLKEIPIGNYYLIILLSVIIGLLSQFFIKGIFHLKVLYNQIKLPVYLKIVFPFVFTALVIINFPNLFGSGEHFIFMPIELNADIQTQIFLLIAKFVLLLLAFCSGMPGGIFLPMLVLGALIGNVFASVMVSLGLIGQEYIIVFSLIAMAANFSAIVRSPITAMLLILEMTGAFVYFLPISLGAMISYIVIEMIKIKPVYEMLLDVMLNKEKSHQ
ncbi:ClC family H(+)/Cl(-) exchange transporter [Helcococcus kunzii]|uniref:ClC family H(+)/Cl(-) exchange transporter n=1 Tax=Helcococcus kunzii TaxID=40091 RepID=UPI001C945851|nr:ClC family H(+)/Cl(-) exchange transporter [Helcococcus kunzii]QZO76155.1 ClC family H(+)/Cl(-) exchange transporter [Helcococcus kunzii]